MPFESLHPDNDGFTETEAARYKRANSGEVSQETIPVDGTEVGNNQEKQNQQEQEEEQEKQKQLEKLEAQKQQEQRANDARIKARGIAENTQAPASNPNSVEARKVTGDLDGALREKFP